MIWKRTNRSSFHNLLSVVPSHVLLLFFIFLLFTPLMLAEVLRLTKMICSFCPVCILGYFYYYNVTGKASSPEKGDLFCSCPWIWRQLCAKLKKTPISGSKSKTMCSFSTAELQLSSRCFILCSRNNSRKSLALLPINK